MNFVFPNKPFTFLTVLISFFFVSNNYAGIFKCIDKKGNTFFQDLPCSGGKKETKLILDTSVVSGMVSDPQCKTACDSDRDACVENLEHGNKNTARKLSYCEDKKDGCYSSCIDKSVDRELEELSMMERSTYERELKYKQSLKQEARNQEFWIKRDKEREQKRIRKNCRKYEKKLAKIKAAWERKQRAGWKPKDEVSYLSKIDSAKENVRIECPPLNL